ncbi:MAG: hypothetical protein ACLQBD_12100 [Syntrophobacteraceae bacterium]
MNRRLRKATTISESSRAPEVAPIIRFCAGKSHYLDSLFRRIDSRSAMEIHIPPERQYHE